MKQNHAIRFFTILAIIFAILFSLLYFCIFYFYIPSEASESMTIYTDQIGLYKEKSNADRMVEQLISNNLTAYIYEHENMYVVVSGISTNEEDCEKNEALLSANAYSYVRKIITIYDKEMIRYVENEDYTKVLELIGNQS